MREIEFREKQKDGPTVEEIVFSKKRKPGGLLERIRAGEYAKKKRKQRYIRLVIKRFFCHEA